MSVESRPLAAFAPFHQNKFYLFVSGKTNFIAIINARVEIWYTGQRPKRLFTVI